MKLINISIGLRTWKTVVSVVLALLIVNTYGTTTSRLTFAMLGAMTAMQPTFIESLESVLTQIIGVFFGAVVGVLLLMLPIPYIAATGIGIVLVITVYNLFNIKLSPSLPCMIILTLTTTPDIQPIAYALGRFWDTMIGLSIGMSINTLVFPYNNTRKIKSMIKSLDQEVLHFLEEIFDGDSILPDIERLLENIKELDRQLSIFSKQWVLLRWKKNRNKLEMFETCEKKSRQLVSHMEILCSMREYGRLDSENRRTLAGQGALIQDIRLIDESTELDLVTNYHVRQVLQLRKELLDTLR